MSKAKKLHTLKRILTYIWKRPWWFIIAVALAVISNIMALFGPMLSGLAIDQLKLGKGRVYFEGVFYYAMWMLITYVASAMLSYLLSVIMLKISKNITYQLRKDVFQSLMEVPVSYYDTHPIGDIISKISYDIDTVNTSLSSDMVTLCSSVITVVGSFFMMCIISPRLVLVFVVTVPISWFASKRLTGITRPLFRKRSAKMGELNGFVEERITGIKTLKAYDQEENTIQEFKQQNQEAVDAYYQAEYFSSTMGPMVGAVNNLSISLVSVFGAYFYLIGEMTLGSISSFTLYSRKFSGPINEAANIISDLQSSITAAERVFRLIDEAKERTDSKNAVKLTEVEGRVELKNVTFGYTSDETIIHDISFLADSGKTIAIVGATGSGKTTLINLLMRFYDVTSGKITLDQKEIEGIQRESLRRSFAMVLQDTWLFHGTIYENIAYGNEHVTKEEVYAAAKAANIHDYIMRLKNGYDTVLTDDGANLSKGQKQMITIARAMLLDASMLILDEATSNVDTRTELLIQEAMKRLMKGKTCFIIAHRLSTIQNVDHILVIEHGEIIEQGNHKELMQQWGPYRQMYESQFE